MTKKDNLYSEVMITESPFYYDENGRLRARVLSEESIRGPEKREEVMVPAAEPKTPPTPPTPPTQNKPKRTLGGLFGKLKNKKGLGPIPAKGSGDDGIVRISPIERPRDGDDDRGGMVFAGGGNKKDGSSHERINAPKPVSAPVPEIRDMRARLPIQRGGGSGQPNRPRPLPAVPPGGADDGGGMVRPAVQPFGKNDDVKMRTADMRDSDLDGTDDRDQTPSKPALAPIKSVRGPGRNMNTRKGLRGVGDLKARGEELKKRGDNLRGRIAALKDKKREMKADFKNKVRGLKDKLGKGRRRGGLVPRSMQESAPATDYLNEKMNLKTAKMGDVIKDFQESDAPQFKGKSKAKRRIMAIAAKLQAERG